MEAIILAGGFGTRLQGVIDKVPKAMAPINEIPFLEIVLKNLLGYFVIKGRYVSLKIKSFC